MKNNIVIKQLRIAKLGFYRRNNKNGNIKIIYVKNCRKDK